MKPDKEKFFEGLRNFLRDELGVEASERIRPDDALFGDETGLGSLDALEIIAYVDSEYDVNMTGQDKERFATMAAIYECVESVLSERAEE